MNDVKEIQALIDATDYWDEVILDVRFSSFGDVLEIVIQADESTAWVISLIRCLRVNYETDASWRGPLLVSALTPAQKGYFGQSIEVSCDGSAYRAILNLTILNLDVTCYEISVENASWKDSETGIILVRDES